MLLPKHVIRMETLEDLIPGLTSLEEVVQLLPAHAQHVRADGRPNEGITHGLCNRLQNPLHLKRVRGLEHAALRVLDARHSKPIKRIANADSLSVGTDEYRNVASLYSPVADASVSLSAEIEKVSNLGSGRFLGTSVRNPLL